MGWIILAAIIGLPFAEIAMFIIVGGQIGVFGTLAAIVLAGVIGIAILRRQGLSVLMDSRAMMARGEVPAQQFAEAMMLALAGFLLLLPGFLSDIVGFVLLIPPVRQALYRLLSRHMVVVTSYRPAGAARPNAGQRTIELDSNDYRRD